MVEGFEALGPKARKLRFGVRVYIEILLEDAQAMVTVSRKRLQETGKGDLLMSELQEAPQLTHITARSAIGD